MPLSTGLINDCTGVDLSLLREMETDSRAEVASLQSQLSAQREKTSLLEHELQLLKRKLVDSTKEKEDCIRTLNHELEKKSSSIAYLVTQLHQTKRLLHKTLESQRQVATKPLRPHPPLQPSPPSESPPEAAYRTGKITKRLRRTCSSPVTEEQGDNQRQLPTIPPYASSPSPSPCPPPPLPGIDTNSFPATQSRVSRPHVTFSHPLHAPITPSTWARHHPSLVQPPSSSYSKGNSESSQHLISANRTVHSKTLPPTVSQRSPTGRSKIVLPPIQSTSDHSDNLSMSKSDFPVRDPTVKSTAAVIARTGRGHRRLILAKSQGLSSAPSSLRRLSYPPPRVLERDTKEMEEEEEEGEQEDQDEEEELTEGTLVVRQGIGSQGNWRQLHQSHAK